MGRSIARLATLTGVFLLLLSSSGFGALTDKQIEREYRRLSTSFSEVQLKSIAESLVLTGPTPNSNYSAKLRLSYIKDRASRYFDEHIADEEFWITTTNVTDGTGYSSQNLLFRRQFPLIPNLVTCSSTLRPQDHLRPVRKLNKKDTPTRREFEQAISDVPSGQFSFFELDARSKLVPFQQKWLRERAVNSRFLIRGTDPALKEEPILIGVHLDPPAYVSEVSPGATSALNLSAALCLAEELKRNRPPRPIEFVFFSGHHAALLGEREFARARLKEGGPAYRLALTFDFSSGSPTLGIYGHGNLYDYRSEVKDPVRRASATWRGQASRLVALYGEKDEQILLHDSVNDSDGRSWRSNLASPLATGSEPLTLVGYPSLTLATIHDDRAWLGTPFDTLERHNLSHILRQLRVSACLLVQPLHNGFQEKFDGYPPFPTEPTRPTVASLIRGSCTLKGQVVEFDPNRSLFADRPVPGALVVVPGRSKDMFGVQGDIVVMADETGHFEIPGLPIVSSYWQSQRPVTKISAFVLDGQGDIVAASTRGATSLEREFFLVNPIKDVRVVVAPLKPIAVGKLVNPSTLQPLKQLVLDQKRAQTPPRDYETFTTPQRMDGFAERPLEGVVFLRDQDSGRFLAQAEGASGVLTFDLGPESPSWVDQPLDHAEEGLLSELKLLLNRFERFRIVPPDVVSKLESARESDSALPELLKIAPLLRSMSGDLVTGALVVMFLLIPFSVLVERIFFPTRTLNRRLLVLVGVFGLSLTCLGAIHPAFVLIKSPVIVFVSFAMAALTLYVLAVILSRFDSDHRFGRRSGLGVNGLSGMAPLALAASNLHRRRFRTLLTAGTLGACTFVLLCFTSVVPGFIIGSYGLPTSSSKPGLVVRDPSFRPLLDSDQITNLCSGQKVGWAYPDPINQSGTYAAWVSGERKEFKAVCGVEEPATVFEGMHQVRVSVAGQVFDAWTALEDQSAEGLRLADGTSALPVDFALAGFSKSQTATGYRAFPTYAPQQVLFTGLDSVQKLGGSVRLILSRKNPSQDVLRRLATQSDLLLITSDGGKSSVVAGTFGLRQEGTAFLVLPFALTALFVLSALLSGVEDRRSEIGVLSALGLKPSGIGAIFVFESAYLAILGVISGLFVALLFGRISIETGQFQSLTLNFGSSGATLAILFVIAIALVGSLYPARLASRIASPHVAEPQLHTGEDGILAVDLPFTLTPSARGRLLRDLAQEFERDQRLEQGSWQIRGVEQTPDHLNAEICAPPYDLGVVQHLVFLARPSQVPGIDSLTVELAPIAGDDLARRRVNARLVPGLKSLVLELLLRARQEVEEPQIHSSLP